MCVCVCVCVCVWVRKIGWLIWTYPAWVKKPGKNCRQKVWDLLFRFLLRGYFCSNKLLKLNFPPRCPFSLSHKNTHKHTYTYTHTLSLSSFSLYVGVFDSVIVIYLTKNFLQFFYYIQSQRDEDEIINLVHFFTDFDSSG